MYKRLGLFLLFVLMFSAIPVSMTDSECDFSLSNHAHAAARYAVGDYTSALHHYQCALEQDPDSQFLRYQVWNAYQQIGDLATTPVEPAQPTIGCDPTISHFEKGMEYRLQKDFENALAHFECVLKQTPDDHALLMLIGNIHGNLGDLRTAQYYFNRSGIGLLFYDASVMNPTSSICDSQVDHFEKGVALRAQGDFTMALAHLGCVLIETPDDPALLMMIGNIYGNMGDIRTAQYYFDRSGTGILFYETSVMKQIDPACEGAISQFALGSQLYAMGELGKALTAYHCALNQDPDNVTLMIQIAQIYIEIEAYDTSLTYLNRASQIDDQNALLYTLRGYVKYELDHLSDALLDLNVALDINPNLEYTREIREWVLAALGQVETLSVESPASKNALPQLDEDFVGQPTTALVSEVAPTSPSADTLRQSALDFFNATEFELAIAQYQALLAFEPYNIDAHFKLGYAHYALENPVDAVVYMTQVLDMNPDHLYAKYYLAMSYAMLDMPHKALSIMSSLYIANQQDGSYPLAIGHVFRNMGHADDAGIEFYKWIEAHELLRIAVDTPIDSTPTTLVMDYGVVYEVPFYVNAGSTVEIRAESHILNRLPIDPLIVVLSADGLPVGGDDDNGELFDAVLDFVAPTSGEYTLLVSHAGGKSKGDLSLTLSGQAWSAEMFRREGQIAYAGHDYDRAVNMITRAIALDGGVYGDVILRADAYHKLGNTRNAILDYQTALDIAPTADIYARIGRIYRQIGDLDSAAVAYSNALELAPTLDIVRCELGIIYATWGDYQQALAQFDSVLTRNITDPCAWSNRDAVLQLMRKPTTSAAPATISKAHELAKQGKYHLSQGHTFNAANLFIKALNVDPTLYDVRCELGMIFIEWGNYGWAIEQFDAVLDGNRTDTCALTNREIAVQKIYKVMTPRVIGSPAQALVAEAHQLKAQNRIFSAANTFMKALKVDPSLHDVRCELAMILSKWGNYRTAIEHYDMILMHNSTHDCAVTNREATIEKMYRPFVQTATTPRYTATDSDNKRTQTIYDYPALPDAVVPTTQEVDALYNGILAMGKYALMHDAQVRYEQGDVWMASALLDRYIDSHYALNCAGELRWLANEYREQGYSVMADMLYLKAIGDSTC